MRTSADISRQRHRRKTRIAVSCPRCGIGAHFLNPDHVEAPAAVPSRRGEQPNAGVVQRDGRAMVRSRDNNTVVFDRWPYRRALAAIAALGLVAAVGSLCFFAVDSADYAIVTEFGKPTQVITTPGLGFKHPLQSVRTFDHRLFVYAAPPSEFLTLEKTPVVASGTILWRVADPKRYFETVVDRRSAESRTRRYPIRRVGGRYREQSFGRVRLDGCRSLPSGCHRRRDCSAV